MEGDQPGKRKFDADLEQPALEQGGNGAHKLGGNSAGTLSSSSRKRRLIIWSHEKHCKATAFCDERSREIINKLDAEHNTNWRPQVCFPRNDPCSKKTWKQISERMKTLSRDTTQFGPYKKSENDVLYLQQLKDKASKICKLNREVETIMFMTISDKTKFVDVVEDLTGDGFDLKNEKPPFVALLERKEEEESLWEKDSTLDPGQWKLETLSKDVAPATPKPSVAKRLKRS